MGFINQINFKKTMLLFAGFVLLGTNMLMAQSTAATDATKVDWLSVGYYILLFFSLVQAVVVYCTYMFSIFV